MKYLALCALILLCSAANAQAPRMPVAHLHVEGVILGQPYAWDDYGVLQGITSVPSPWLGYTITSFDFVGRQPDDQLHTDEFTYTVDWE